LRFVISKIKKKTFYGVDVPAAPARGGE
jgi:hypothetical protein